MTSRHPSTFWAQQSPPERAAALATRWTSWGPGRALAAGPDNGKHISRIKTEVFQRAVEWIINMHLNKGRIREVVSMSDVTTIQAQPPQDRRKKKGSAMNKFWPNRDRNGQLNKKEPVPREKRHVPLCDGIHVYTTGMVIVSGANECAMSTQLYIMEFKVLNMIPTTSWMALHLFASPTSLGRTSSPPFKMATKNNETSMVQVCSCSFPYSYTVPYPDCSITSKLVQQYCII